MTKKTKGEERSHAKTNARGVGDRPKGSETNAKKEKPKRAVDQTNEDAFDVDDLFRGAKSRSVKEPEAKRTKVSEPIVRVLLPGQKKPKQKRQTAEFTPVEKPRRFEDGLPVYKSYGDFSDMKAGQNVGESGGACPFDCNCCF